MINLTQQQRIVLDGLKEFERVAIAEIAVQIILQTGKYPTIEDKTTLIDNINKVME